MNGLTLIDAIRNVAKRQVPAILITADRSPQVQELAAAHEVQCLRKPLRPAALRAAIGHARMQGAAAEAAGAGPSPSPQGGGIVCLTLLPANAKSSERSAILQAFYGLTVPRCALT